METKRCARCGNVLPLSDFYREGDAPIVKNVERK